ncbi:hypothetical protein EVAR_39931_1 [Eumeta japonica]|uniref:Uncharacterized protein n=1 Tax=Eumeta variegata TaxID=151549 RepID=A0A4C1WMG2_EUMVA|nr:hypothetical protein EVAR_39931_1 [Eumeta japonica]
MLWSILLQHVNGLGCRCRIIFSHNKKGVKYQSAVSFRLVSESSDGPLTPQPSSISLSPLHQPTPFSIRYPISTQEPDRALMTPTVSRMSMGGRAILLTSAFVSLKISEARRVRRLTLKGHVKPGSCDGSETVTSVIDLQPALSQRAIKAQTLDLKTKASRNLACITADLGNPNLFRLLREKADGSYSRAGRSAIDTAPYFFDPSLSAEYNETWWWRVRKTDYERGRWLKGIKLMNNYYLLDNIDCCCTFPFGGLELGWRVTSYPSRRGKWGGRRLAVVTQVLSTSPEDNYPVQADGTRGVADRKGARERCVAYAHFAPPRAAKAQDR